MENLRTPESLAPYISPDDAELTRKEFLFTVATRILDDLHIEHNLKFDQSAGILRVKANLK